jgi:hypothetical protein
MAAHALLGREHRLPALRISRSLRRGADSRARRGQYDHSEQERTAAAPGHLVALAM